LFQSVFQGIPCYHEPARTEKCSWSGETARTVSEWNHWLPQQDTKELSVFSSGKSDCIWIIVYNNFQIAAKLELDIKIFTVVPCMLILSKSFIYQLMHKRVA